MGIEFTLETDLQFKSIVSELETLNKRIVKELETKVIPQAQNVLDTFIDQDLRKYPPRRQRGRKFVWSNDPEANERGRRGFWARHPEAKNGGYKRTGGLGKKWIGKIARTGENTITIDVGNSADGAGYVYGSPAFGYNQVPGHFDTGWLNAGVKVPTVILRAGIVIEQKTTDVVDREITRVLKSGKV